MMIRMNLVRITDTDIKMKKQLMYSKFLLKFLLVLLISWKTEVNNEICKRNVYGNNWVFSTGLPRYRSILLNDWKDSQCYQNEGLQLKKKD